MVIIKPKMSGVCADAQVAHLSFLGHYQVKVDGFSVGIWLLWDLYLVSVNIISKHFQCLHIQLSFYNGKNCIFLLCIGA